MPALAFLRETVEQILADGVVTEHERTELYKAIETVLPIDIRDGVRGRRVSAENAVKEHEQIETYVWHEIIPRVFSYLRQRRSARE